uniref:Uncharacterized protein n=1 Tax=Panagrolaimus sp. PS1159 TaxID=55785 RepID=A0AC35GP86_9BILA
MQSFDNETKHDIYEVPQKIEGKKDPIRHIVEYTRAMDAAKLERVFAEPSIAYFDGHNEGVGVLSNHYDYHIFYLAQEMFKLKFGDYQVSLLMHLLVKYLQQSDKIVKLEYLIDLVIVGEGISVWKLYRGSPVRTFDVGCMTIHYIRCSTFEASVIAVVQLTNQKNLGELQPQIASLEYDGRQKKQYQFIFKLEHHQVPIAIFHTAKERKIIRN